MKSGSLVVRHHSPWRGWLVQAGLVGLVIALSVGLYYFGQYQAGYNQIESRELQKALEASIESLEDDKAELKDQIALVQQSSQVDAQAYQQVKDDLKLLQQENLELREEVSFYRGIVAPRESSSGMRVESFKIEKMNDNGLYHYKFVLTQVLKNDRSVRGTVAIDIDGISKGKPKVLSLAKVSVGKRKKHEFKFKYFQKFEGDLQLPKGFTPRQVLMEVNPFKRKKIQSKIEWPSDDKTPEQEMTKSSNT